MLLVPLTLGWLPRPGGGRRTPHNSVAKAVFESVRQLDEDQVDLALFLPMLPNVDQEVELGDAESVTLGLLGLPSVVIT